ncbi:LacI family DNA-binding transcriptional regulator [Pectobacterium brasiliense]|uniref:LacI family DNA-binding transcriptional regulator n=1 Tax=Pectobacterium brasiliense TaxID=180957 RepID=UPI0032EEFB7D
MSLKTIANNLGLSVAAVSRALNGHRDISDATRQRIQEEAERIGYRPNTHARRLKMGKSNAVGLVYPYASSLSNDIFFEMIGAISRKLAQHEVDFLLLADEQDACQGAARLIASRRIDALIVAHTCEQDARLTLLQRNNVPFLALGRSQLPHPYAWFDFDNRAGMALATEHLIALGHRRIAMLSEDHPQAFIMQRRQGYRDALQCHGLPFHDAYLRCVNPTRRAGYQAILDLLALPEPPTAMVMDGNVHGDGAVAALQQAGRLSGSHPIALVMYDGLPQDSLTDITVTAIEQATREQVGEQIASMMQALIAGEAVENLQVLWQPTLRLGNTSFPA